MALTTAGYDESSERWLRENRWTSPPFLNASIRIPSSLRSKIQSGPVNRSCVSVAAIGSSHSGNAVIATPSRRRLEGEAGACSGVDNVLRRPVGQQLDLE